MATQHLDLDEQEQIANIKYFWQKYGLWISAAVTVCALGYLGWAGWQWWQSTQSQKAAVLFDELSKAATAGDIAKTDRVFADMKDKFSSTAYTAQAALLDARMNYEKGQIEPAKAALQWLVASGAEAAYKDLARLRLAGVLIEGKSYDEAIQLLGSAMSPSFQALAADRMGDAYALQNKKDEAKAQYQKAYAALEETNEYRKMLEVKLARLGVDASAVRPSTSK
jgi:predicted negative regulator of RcsB-dependent stress response